jgi:hypothetical protein
VTGSYDFGDFFSLFLSCCSQLEHRAPVKRFVSLQFLNPTTVDWTPWRGDQPVARTLRKYRTTQTEKNSHTHQTPMPEVGFEPTITASARANTVYDLDRSASVTGILVISFPIP